MKSIQLLLLALISAFVLASCADREQVDVTPPAILSVVLNNASTDTLFLQAGQTYSLEVALEDNKMLETLELNGSFNTAQPIPPIGNWVMDENFALNNATQTIDYLFAVPDSTASIQNLQIKVLDSNGYLDQMTLPVIVSNDDAPSITGTTLPAANSDGLIQMSAGQNLVVSGEAFGIDGLASLKVMLWNTNNVITAETEIAITGNPMAFSEATFDNADAGHYRLVIEAIDESGHKTYWAKWVHVS